MNRPKIITLKRIPDEAPVSLWYQCLDAVPSYSYFQTPKWSRLLSSAFMEMQPYSFYVQFEDEKECVVPCMRITKRWGFKKLEALPWNTYGSPLGEGIEAPHIHALGHALLSLRQPVFQMSLHPVFYGKLQINQLTPYRIEPQTTRILHLNQTYEELEKHRFQPRLRTTIHKADRTGISVRWANDSKAVEAFQRLYRQACGRWGEELTVPTAFFERLENTSGEDIRIWMAEYQSQVIAADIILYGKLEVQYFTGAMDVEYAHLNAAKYLMSRIIQDACAREYGLVNFGSSAGLQGVEQFKERFGGIRTYSSRLMYRHFMFRWI